MELNTRLVRRSDVMTAEMDGSIVTMDIVTGKYYNFGETGGAIWNLLEEEKTLKEVVTILTAEYSISEEECQKGVESFLDTLISRGLVTIR